jgi:hypothetical protein
VAREGSPPKRIRTTNYFSFAIKKGSNNENKKLLDVKD